KVLGEWVALDRTNIVNRAAQIYWVVGPLEYETGKPPSETGKFGIAAYWHPDNVGSCTRNLARAAASLALIARVYGAAAPIKLERIAAAHDVLRTHWDVTEDSVRNVLRTSGLDFGPPGDGC